MDIRVRKSDWDRFMRMRRRGGPYGERVLIMAETPAQGTRITLVLPCGKRVARMRVTAVVPMTYRPERGRRKSVASGTNKVFFDELEELK